MCKELINILEQEFLKRQNVNSQYSLRSYARNLEISPAVLSKIFNGKTAITPKIFQRISAKLNIDPNKHHEIENQLVKISKSNRIKTTELSESTRNLQMEEFNFISNWFHYAIMEIFNLDEYNESPKWIARKLGIDDEQKVKDAIERLLTLRLLQRDHKGRLSPSDRFTTILDYNFSSVAMRERQKQIMDLSSRKIDTIAITHRDHSSITLTIDDDLLPDIKEKIKNFRRTLGNYIVKNSKKRDSIYEVHIGLIPLTEK